MTVVRRQGIKNTIYGYFGILLGILSTIYIQPFFLTKEQIGLTRTILSSAIILSVISNLGSTIVNIKFLPNFYNPQKKHYGFFTIVVLFPLLGFTLCCLFILIFKQHILNFYSINSSILLQYFYPILLITFFNCMVLSFSTYCNAINKSSLATFVNEIINRTGYIICILLFSYGILTQTAYLYLLSIVYFVQLTLLFSIISYYDYPTFKLSFLKKNIHLKKIVVFGLTSSFMQITGVGLKFIDVIFVGKYESMKQVGIYSIAAFIGLVLETPLNAVERIAGPKISKLFIENNLNEIEKIYTLSTKYLMVFCGLMGSILVVCIKPTLALLPNDYSSGSIVTIIICVGAFFNAATGVNYSIIMYSKYYKISAIFYSLLLIITISLYVLLIPIRGIMGAAIATCLASVIHNLLRFIFIKRKLNMQPFNIDSLKVILIIAITVLLGFYIVIENNYLLILVRGTLTALVFIVLLIVLKVFSIKEIKEEISSIKKTFN